MKVETIIFTCDISGELADEQVLFEIDGQKYNIDLTCELANEFREKLKPFINVAKLKFSRPTKFSPKWGKEKEKFDCPTCFGIGYINEKENKPKNRKCWDCNGTGNI